MKYYRRPDPASGFLGSESVAEACNRGPLGPGGNLGWAQSFASGWGYGIGLFTPAAGVPNTRWGTDTIVPVAPQSDEEYPPTLRGVESPTRQMLIERDGIGGFLAAGLGWAPVPSLRLGVSAGVAMLKARVAVVGSTTGGTFRDHEMLLENTAVDHLIPRATAALAAAVAPWLELFGTITYQDDFRGEGHAEITANGIRGEPLADCSARDPGTHCRLRGVRVELPQTRLEATWGMRFAGRHSVRTRALPAAGRALGPRAPGQLGRDQPRGCDPRQTARRPGP